MRHSHAFAVAAIVVGVGRAMSAAAGSCLDYNWEHQANGLVDISMTNTCGEAVEVKLVLPRNRKKTCAVLHIAPGATRIYRQKEVCGGLNHLQRGCVCEHEFIGQERKIAPSAQPPLNSMPPGHPGMAVPLDGPCKVTGTC